MKISSLNLDGKILDYAVAKAIGLAPVYKDGVIICSVNNWAGHSTLVAPSHKEPWYVLQIMKDYWIVPVREDGYWTAYPKHGYSLGTYSSLEKAVAVVFVSHEIGPDINIPSELIKDCGDS